MRPSMLVDTSIRAMQRAEREVLVKFVGLLQETGKNYEVLLNAQMGAGRILTRVRVGEVRWENNSSQTGEGLLELVDESSDDVYQLRVTDQDFEIGCVRLGFNLGFTYQGEDVVMLTGNVVGINIKKP